MTEEIEKKVIRIEVEKIKTQDGRAYKIISVDALRERELPTEYKEKGYPYVYLARTGLLVICTKDDSPKYIESGNSLIPEAFDQRLELVRVAGNRLHEINEKIKKECDGWEGKEVYVI